METLVTIVHVIVALFMILVVLVQGGNQGGIGAAFGGGNSQGVFGASGATSFLGKLTYAAAMIFMVTSVSLAIMQGKGGDVGMSERLKTLNEEKAQQQNPEPKTTEETPAAKQDSEGSEDEDKASGSQEGASKAPAGDKGTTTTPAAESKVPAQEQENK
ncbi:MAG: preprotein translocase subunit SecG [Oligoflexales bacterium]